MALPIWAIYMKKVWADKSLDISKGDFERPSKPLSVETDCAKYNREHPEEQNIDMWRAETIDAIGFN